MKKLFIRFLVLGCVVATGLLPAAHAESFTNELPGLVFDVGGDYSEDLGDGFVIDYTVSQDGKGKLTGYGFASQYDPWLGLTVEMDFIVKGKIKSKNNVFYVMQKLSAKGVVYDDWTGEIYGYFKASIVMKAELDALNKALSGTVTVKVAGESETEYFYEVLDDPDMDGSAVMYTDIEEIEGRLMGTSLIELSNGRILYCDAKAKENTKTALLQITAKGVKEDPDSNGSKVKLMLDMEGVMQALKGRVCGQQVNWTAE